MVVVFRGFWVWVGWFVFLVKLWYVFFGEVIFDVMVDGGNGRYCYEDGDLIFFCF